MAIRAFFYTVPVLAEQQKITCPIPTAPWTLTIVGGLVETTAEIRFFRGSLELGNMIVKTMKAVLVDSA
jgi:hypothetical protein